MRRNKRLFTTGPKRLLTDSVSVDFSVLLSRFSMLFCGVISTLRILPHKKASKIGQNNPKTRRNLNPLTVSKRWLLFLLVTLSCAGYFLLRAPRYKDLTELPSFFNQSSHFIPLKITKFSSANIPQIEVYIEDKAILAKVDLGWEGGVVLPKGMMDALKNKSFLKKKTFFGIRGRSYESDIYELSDIKIGKLRMFSIWAEEENHEFIEDGVLKTDSRNVSEEYLGIMGWHIFKPFNLFLDCDHSTMVMCDSLETIRQQGYPVEAFVEAPLLLDRGTIDFEVMTQAGPLRCMLDTGSTWNLLNKDFDHIDQDHRLIDLEHLNGKPPEFNSANEDLLVFDQEDKWETGTLQINRVEFGPLNFVKMRSPIDLDAIIGMEFIDNHLIFIDFRNEKIYFSKLPEERSLFERACEWIQSKMSIISVAQGYQVIL